MDSTKIPHTEPRQSATFDPYTLSEIRRAAARATCTILSRRISSP